MRYAMLFLAACASKPALSSSNTSTGGGTSTSSTGVVTEGTSTGVAQTSSSTGTDSSSSSSSASGGGSGSTGSSCLAAPFLTAIGKSHFLIGFSKSEEPPNYNNALSTTTEPFDIRYEYLSDGIPDAAASCTPKDCADNTCNVGESPGNWWGCYDYTYTGGSGDAVGQFPTYFAGLAGKQIPMLTYYELFQTATADISGFSEPDVASTAVNNSSLMERYYNDWRLVLQRVADTNQLFLLHFEPDFWGFAEQLAENKNDNDDPSQLPALVASANPTDCPASAGYGDTIADFGKCIIAMTHKYAPKALVSLHASAWASGPDLVNNRDSSVNVTTHAATIASFLKACGAGDTDFIVGDLANADADFYQYYFADDEYTWDDSNATLPNFTQAWTYSSALTQALGKPLLWWQVPVGNGTITDDKNHTGDLPSACSKSDVVSSGGDGVATFWDNRVDYFFAHLPDVVNAGGVGVAFGPGLACDTVVGIGGTETGDDGGYLVSQTETYAASNGNAGVAVCK